MNQISPERWLQLRLHESLISFTFEHVLNDEIRLHYDDQKSDVSPDEQCDLALVVLFHQR
jgi:hypothetical protein